MSQNQRLTPSMQRMLHDLAEGADLVLGAQLARALGRKHEAQFARTLLALMSRHMVVRNDGSLEITAVGQAWVQAHPRVQAMGVA